MTLKGITLVIFRQYDEIMSTNFVMLSIKDGNSIWSVKGVAYNVVLCTDVPVNSGKDLGQHWPSFRPS